MKRFTLGPVHRSRCNPHYLSQNSTCCQVIFKNRPVKCAIRWWWRACVPESLACNACVTESVTLAVDPSTIWNGPGCEKLCKTSPEQKTKNKKQTRSYLLSSASAAVQEAVQLTASHFSNTLSHTHTQSCFLFSIHHLTSLWAPTKLLFPRRFKLKMKAIRWEATPSDSWCCANAAN